MSDFAWSEFLDVAAFCSNWQGASPSRTALDRTAVGRAYYAAFCTAASLVNDRGWYVLQHEAVDHGEVVKALRDHQCVDTARLIGQLREWRRISDYEENEMRDFAGMASRAINDARKAIGRLPSSGRW